MLSHFGAWLEVSIDQAWVSWWVSSLMPSSIDWPQENINNSPKRRWFGKAHGPNYQERALKVQLSKEASWKMELAAALVDNKLLV